MKTILRTILKEARSLMPATLFFFVIFSLAAVTEDLFKKQEHLGGYIRLTTIMMSSLIMGKTVFLADHSKWVHLFSKKPLIYVTMWKSVFYVLMSILLRLTEHMASSVLERQEHFEGFYHFLLNVNWIHFWVVQAWLIVLFVIFVSWRELANVIGKEKVRILFFWSVG